MAIRDEKDIEYARDLKAGDEKALKKIIGRFSGYTAAIVMSLRPIGVTTVIPSAGPRIIFTRPTLTALRTALCLRIAADRISPSISTATRNVRLEMRGLAYSPLPANMG
ncbi:MAG: hypothetical protein VB064_13590 [Oscillospiraceae bacterium]|nr:hypothetical protein [Oscillospiraceae bacterium]